jgi:nitrogen regulatory protein PII
MHFKLIIALIEDPHSDEVMKAARDAGATGATLVSQARGEGVEDSKTFFGLTLEKQCDMLLFLVEEHLARTILETIADVGKLEGKGHGIAFQIDVEDAVGVSHQMRVLASRVEDEL